MWSRFQATFGCYCCPSSLNAESIHPFDVSGVRGELLAKCNNFKLGKKRLEAVSKRWTEVIVHQEFQAASLFSKATASLTSAVDTL